MKNLIRIVVFLLPLMIASMFSTSCDNNSNIQSNNDYEVLSTSSQLLSVENKELQLGEINKNNKKVIPFTFSVRNVSDSLLVIDKIDVSCSCVKVTDYPKQLETNQVGEIVGVIDIGNQSGHIRKSIFVNYSDTCITMMKIVADVAD